jgi:hypothetical protein
MIKSRRMRWVGHVAHMEENMNAYRVLVGKPEENRPLGRTLRRWENNIKMGLKEIEWCGMNLRVENPTVISMKSLIHIIGVVLWRYLYAYIE